MTHDQEMTPAKPKTSATTLHEGGGRSSTPPELIDRALDRGLVVDGWAGVSLLGIELLTVDARAVVMSIETYLQYAGAIGGTTLAARPQSQPAQPTSVAKAGGTQQQLGGKQTQALSQPQRQHIMSGQQGQQQQVQQQWEQQGQPKQATGQPAQTLELDGLQQQLAQAVQPILAAQQQYLMHAVQSQLDPVFDMLCQRVQREVEAALEPSWSAIRQELAQALEPVRVTLRDELAQALEPICMRLRQQVEQAFVGIPSSPQVS